ncbi:unnamed protein product [Phytophthora lilii]|uniref:Unnamed protein product n=1 Tax=Phytophthora lilii TaxID=2077276 RepID=A0A9W6TYJ7_9STRA|nr:unnamed protein product [Phytophthora lilii]
MKSKYQLDVSVDVLLSNYRKSPENPSPTPDNDCMGMYKYVLKHENISPDHVLFSGDSAGAKMSLVNCMRMCDSTPELLPLGCLLYSPSVDFEEKEATRRLQTASCRPHLWTRFTRRTSQMSLTRRALKVSPINGDLRNLPPMFVQYGTLERFYEQGMRIIAKAKEQGVINWEVDLLENMPHGAVMLPTNISPAAKEGIRHGCEFAAKLATGVLFKEPEPEVAT